MSGIDVQPYDVFVSYAEADRSWVVGYLLDALQQGGVRINSEAAFALGRPRLLEFEDAIKKSRRIILVLSPAYLADGFDQYVDLLAQTYGLESATWPVIPLVLHSATLPPRLALLTRLDATDPASHPDVIARLCKALEHPVPGPAPRPACPYPGMRPFREEDSGRFFGRQQEVGDLLQRLRLHPFIAVIGPSGSGKSSLVLAGLVPALRRSGLFGPGSWQVVTTHPAEPAKTPLQALENVFRGDLSDPAKAVARLLTGQTAATRVLLIVDQFEELFALDRGEVVPFQQALLRLVETRTCHVVLTVRADFYPELMTSPMWRQIQAHRYEVVPLDEAGLHKAIVSPAEDAGVFVEAALVERMVGDAAGEPGILPFVQETLVMLWERLERRFLPLSAYEALVLPRTAYGSSSHGQRTGLQVAMALHADSALAALTAEQQAIARRIFVRLVQFGEGRADTRRRQSTADLQATGDDPALFRQTLQHLAEHRLLTLSGQETGCGKEVDLAHEALITGWPKLQDWVAVRHESESTRRRLETKTKEWERMGCGSGGLLGEIELLEAERWLTGSDARDLGYSDSLVKLVQASRARLDEERARERRRTHRTIIGLLTGLGVFAVLAALLGGMLIDKVHSLRRERLAYWIREFSRDLAEPRTIEGWSPEILAKFEEDINRIASGSGAEGQKARLGRNEALNRVRQEVDRPRVDRRREPGPAVAGHRNVGGLRVGPQRNRGTPDGAPTAVEDVADRRRPERPRLTAWPRPLTWTRSGRLARFSKPRKPRT